MLVEIEIGKELNLIRHWEIEEWYQKLMQTKKKSKLTLNELNWKFGYFNGNVNLHSFVSLNTNYSKFEIITKIMELETIVCLTIDQKMK